MNPEEEAETITETDVPIFGVTEGVDDYDEDYDFEDDDYCSEDADHEHYAHLESLNYNPFERQMFNEGIMMFQNSLET